MCSKTEIPYTRRKNNSKKSCRLPLPQPQPSSHTPVLPLVSTSPPTPATYRHRDRERHASPRRAAHDRIVLPIHNLPLDVARPTPWHGAEPEDPAAPAQETLLELGAVFLAAGPHALGADVAGVRHGREADGAVGDAQGGRPVSEWGVHGEGLRAIGPAVGGARAVLGVWRRGGE